MRMNQSLKDCWQSSVLLWDKFGWINWLLSPLKFGDREVDSLGFGFMVGPNFDDNPLVEPVFYLF